MKKGFLTFLATVFKTVEINSSFYHLPLAKTFSKWASEVPEDFRFAVKLSRYITHQKMLKGVKRETKTFLDRAECMKEKLRVILIQLPPRFKFDQKKVEKFLKDLREMSSWRFALEPRHKSWFEEVGKVRKLLKKYDIAMVIAQSSRLPNWEPIEENITSDYTYIRFHGPREFAASLYGEKDLKPWADLIKKWQKKLDVFVYFNNDIHGYALEDAQTLVKLCR